MSNLAYISLLKDQQVEAWDEYQEWKEYQERIAADAANQSFWGSITGIVAGVGTFMATGNPYLASAAYTAGNRVGQEVTEWTGYEPGYDTPDIGYGRWNKVEGQKMLDDEEARLEGEKTANLIGIGTDLFSIVTSLYSAGKYATDVAIREGAETAGQSIADWTIEDGVVYDEAGFHVSEQELAGMGLNTDLTPMAGYGWDPQTLSTGRMFDPITGEISTPGFFSKEGKVWRQSLFEEVMPGYEKGKTLYDLLNFQRENN
ncbi:MAG: hypothetical protein Unbinned1966contig1000_2 [Prokaryotic dsDNA virus sp.]|nr:MAG: hypothetical protein Unbinned1966contig1000_2 [Prokaryotic dsDNA virus sp.]|tara:strand:+ start:382 stop:1158 length:777 start_codon:yes stop_codon:yes gene_type:complete